jgi:hypothetical protein
VWEPNGRTDGIPAQVRLEELTNLDGYNIGAAHCAGALEFPVLFDGHLDLQQIVLVS